MFNTQKFWWLAKRPYLYPELLRRTSRRIKFTFFPGLDTYKAEVRIASKRESTKWCQQYAIDTKSALHKITGFDELTSFYDQFSTILEQSEEIQKQCPFNLGGAGNLELIYQLSEYLKAEKVLETGVSYGWSSLAFLLSLKNRKNSQLVSTDLPYLFEDREKYVGCVVPEELKAFWQIIPYADRDSLPKALKLLPKIDIAHYDSDKFYEGRIWAYPKLWNALRPGGILISDDINDDFGFRDFAESIGQKPLIITPENKKENTYVGLLIKES